MNKDKEEKFIVSEADAEIIATLFRKGVSDFPSLVKALKWDKKKQDQLFDFMKLMGYYDFGDSLIDDFLGEFVPSLSHYRVPEEKYTEFFQNLPIAFSEDFFDEEWYREVHAELRKFLVRLDKENPMFKNKKAYSLNDMETIVGMAFCILAQRPETLHEEVISLMQIKLRKTGKDAFTFDEILAVFDKVFAMYFD